MDNQLVYLGWQQLVYQGWQPIVGLPCGLPGWIVKLVYHGRQPAGLAGGPASGPTGGPVGGPASGLVGGPTDIGTQL